MNQLTPFVELELTSALLSPEVDLAKVENLVRSLAGNRPAKRRAMHRAVYQGALVPDGQGDSYLHAVELLTRLGIKLPGNAVWLAYADQLNQAEPNPRVQAMARLVVQLGGQGLPALRMSARRFGALTASHADFLDTLDA